MLPSRLGVVMIYVSDMDRSVVFYRDTLGLPLRFQSPEWTEFETEAVTLALHRSDPAPEGFRPPQHPGIVQTGWYVDDMDSVCAELKSRGVHFVMEPQLREGEGIRLAVFLDPDGCPLSLASSA